MLRVEEQGKEKPPHVDRVELVWIRYVHTLGY